MVKLLSLDEIKRIHSVIEEQFPSVLRGIKDEGLVDAAVQRPNQKLYKKLEPFEDIFMKAASIMEAITRWHPFYDGNKRTGLLSAFSFLYKNGYYLVIPLSSVKFTVKIADTRGTDQETTMRLVKEISIWLKNHSSKTESGFAFKLLRYLYFPVIGLRILEKIGFNRYVDNKIFDWFSIKSHPEYEKEIGDVASFLGVVMKNTLNAFKERRIRPKKK